MKKAAEKNRHPPVRGERVAPRRLRGVMIDRVLSHYEMPSPLSRWNPALKAIAVLIVSIMLTFSTHMQCRTEL